MRPVAAADQGVAERLTRRVEQQIAGLGHAAADDEAARVQDRGEVSQALAEPEAMAEPEAVAELSRGQRTGVSRGRMSGW